MTKKRSFSLVVLGLAISLVLILGAGVLPIAPASGSGTVGMVIDPPSNTVTAGNTFTVNINVTISAGEAVNTASAHINFNSACLEVVSITPGAALSTVLYEYEYNTTVVLPQYNNTAGTIDYSAGVPPMGVPAPNATFTLATLTLRAKVATAATPLTFVFLPLRETNAWYTPPGELVQSVLSPEAVVNGNVTINPAAASRLEVMGIADPIVAGIPSGVTVTAKDAYNNTVTSYNGTINFTSSDSQAILPGDYIFHPSDNGTKTFDGVGGVVILRTLGPQWVKATDTVSGITGNQTTNVTANPAVASRLEVTGNATMTAGGTNQLNITAKDQYGNVATSYSGMKNLTFFGPGVAPDGQKPKVQGVVIGSAITVNFTNGVSAANAATLIAYKAETTTVGVSDGNINSTANPEYDLDLTVIPASTARLEVTGNAVMTAGGTNELTITARDQYGNVATSYSGVKNLTFSGPAVASGGQKPTVKGIVIGNVTSVSFTAGVSVANAATLNATKAETTVVNVSDSSVNINSTGGYGLSLTVNAASASRLGVSGIIDPIKAGKASNVTVTASDAYGNIATGYRGTINFTSNDTKATLPGNYTFVAGDNGTRTFINGVTLKTTGEQWVRATDTVTATITGEQTGITVSAAGTNWGAIIGGIIGGLIVIGLLVYLWRRRKTGLIS